MKFNWGTGIFIFIVLFVITCGVFLYYAATQRFSLVEEDYYPKELRYEEKLVKMRNVSALSETVRIGIESNQLAIRFPAYFRGKKIEGTIKVYRPSNENLDVNLPIAVDTALCCNIPLSRLSHGKYVVKVDWNSDGKGYYMENERFIP